MNNTQFEATLTIPLNEHSSFSLAYLGDAFFELWCRQKILQRLKNRRQVHLHVVQWVRCQTQSQLAQLIHPLLNIEEENIYRQGRNSKTISAPKHAAIKDYRAATGFECLVGYWYLEKQTKRFEELMNRAEILEYLESVLPVSKFSIPNAA
ncbi:MAG: ribonuclease III [Deltaproteobacteria bacterium]|nr:ribonuclease III [Deltaproteobacteria bacterium]